MEAVTKLYRYVDSMTSRSLQAMLIDYPVISETPCGYWYMPYGTQTSCMPDEWVKRERRWVSNNGRARKCYPTKKEAWESYRIRKQRHAEILRSQLKFAELRLKAVEGLSVDDAKKSQFIDLCEHGHVFDI